MVVSNHGILLTFHSIFSWECHDPNWRFVIFFRGVGLNHQPDKHADAFEMVYDIVLTTLVMRSIFFWGSRWFKMHGNRGLGLESKDKIIHWLLCDYYPRLAIYKSWDGYLFIRLTIMWLFLLGIQLFIKDKSLTILVKSKIGYLKSKQNHPLQERNFQFRSHSVFMPPACLS